MLKKIEQLLSIGLTLTAITLIIYVGLGVHNYYDQLPPDYAKFETLVRAQERAKVIKEFQELQSLPEFNQCFTKLIAGEQ